VFNLVRRLGSEDRGVAHARFREADTMTARQSIYPLRLPSSLLAEVERRAKMDGASVNQFVATAVAEKLAVMNTAAFFAERRSKADFAAFDQIMSRPGGAEPDEDDRLP
jgi:hypothetical protein